MVHLAWVLLKPTSRYKEVAHKWYTHEAQNATKNICEEWPAFKTSCRGSLVTSNLEEAENKWKQAVTGLPVDLATCLSFASLSPAILSLITSLNLDSERLLNDITCLFSAFFPVIPSVQSDCVPWFYQLIFGLNNSLTSSTCCAQVCVYTMCRRARFQEVSHQDILAVINYSEECVLHFTVTFRTSCSSLKI